MIYKGRGLKPPPFLIGENMNSFQKKLQVGLGEAVQKLNTLHAQITRGVANKAQKEEYKLLLDALNEIKIDLGFDCDEDGIPDSIEIFTKTAKTSCCRLVSFKDSSRASPPKKRGRGRPKGSKNKKKTARG